MEYDTDTPANVLTFTYKGEERVVQDAVIKGGVIVGHERWRGGTPTHAVKSYRLSQVEGKVEVRDWSRKVRFSVSSRRTPKTSPPASTKLHS